MQCNHDTECQRREYVDASGNSVDPGRGEWVCSREADKRRAITSCYSANSQHGRVIGPFQRT